LSNSLDGRDDGEEAADDENDNRCSPPRNLRLSNVATISHTSTRRTLKVEDGNRRRRSGKREEQV